MLKPAFILEDVAVFGLDETIKLVAKRFVRLGKTSHIAHEMARTLVLATVFVPSNK